jgi:hypothetical protein
VRPSKPRQQLRRGSAGWSPRRALSSETTSIFPNQALIKPES